MNILYARQPFPTSTTSSIFLAGPTPRDEVTPSWRPEAIRILRELGFEGLVFVPEPADGKWDGDDLDKWRDQVEWEEEALNRADVIVFWIPRSLPNMLGLTTNDEWGVWKDSGKVILGTSPEAVAVRYQRYYANKYRVSTNTDLTETLKNALARIEFFGGPTLRSEGVATIPLHVYNTPEFRQWLNRLEDTGNRLLSGRVVHSHWLPSKHLFSWGLSANIWVAREQKVKSNEIVTGRPPVSSVLLHGPIHIPWEETKVVLIREFRSNVNNPDAMVCELPGGSNFRENRTPLMTAVSEVEEEVGLVLNPDRFLPVMSRQVFPTFSTHRVSLFRVELTEEEIDSVGNSNQSYGVAEEGETTFPTVMTVREAMWGNRADWSTLGMILSSIPFVGSETDREGLPG